MSDARTRTPSTTTGTDVLLYLLLGIAALGIGGGSLAWLFGNLTNAVLGTDPWAPYEPTQALFHPEDLWPHLDRPALLTGCRAVPAVLMLTAAVLGANLWLHFRTKKQGLADRGDLRDLLPKKAAAKATGLRPSLKNTKPARVAPDDRGVLLGSLKPGSTEVRSSWEDVLLAIMAPRSGKTSGLAIPAILRAPGAVLLTSNKAGNDAFTATLDERARVGTVWTLDPQQIAHAEQTMWWDILSDAHDLTGARRLAQHFVTASIDESSAGDFWSTAAANTLSALFLAAARGGRPITDVTAWLASPADRTRSTCSPMPVWKPLPLSFRAPSPEPSRRGTASSRTPVSTRAACWICRSQHGSLHPKAPQNSGSSYRRSSLPAATRSICCPRTAAVPLRRSLRRLPMR